MPPQNANLMPQLRQAEADFCRQNPIYFVETYVKIEDKDAAQLMVPFRLWDGQKKALLGIVQNRLSVVLKARQLGFTWLVLAEAARLLVLQPGRSVVGLSRTEQEAKELVRRMGVILKNMPEFCAEKGDVPTGWQGIVFEVTALKITLHFADEPDGSFQAFASSPSVARSFTADLVIIDEWAFQQFADEIWASAFPVVNRTGGGRVVGLSTIRRGSLFEELYTNPDNGFFKIFLPWTADPRRDAAWYKRTCAALGEERTLQEYPATEDEALNVRGGAFFAEVKAETHLAETPPNGAVLRYLAFDYGLDMLSAHWIAVCSDGTAQVYREFNAPDLTIRQAATALLRQSEDEEIEAFLAPPDLWNRSQESGKSRAILFGEAGLPLTQSSRDFPAGCAAMKEWLTPQNGAKKPNLTLRNTPNLYRCLQKIQRDLQNPNVYAKQPHHLTHAVDALRYFCVYWVNAPQHHQPQPKAIWEPDLYEDYNNADPAGKDQMLRLFGNPF